MARSRLRGSASFNPRKKPVSRFCSAEAARARQAVAIPQPGTMLTVLDALAEGGELAPLEAPSRAPVDPAAGQDVQQRDFLGQSERVVKRCQ